jgi:hypothetical protein
VTAALTTAAGSGHLRCGSRWVPGDYGLSAPQARELADRLIAAAAWADVLRKPLGTPDTFTTSQSDD